MAEFTLGVSAKTPRGNVQQNSKIKSKDLIASLMLIREPEER
jgi:hypothetical protein